MALEYTTGRYAFGRPVASFQAIKHKLADIFVALELALLLGGQRVWKNRLVDQLKVQQLKPAA